MKFIRFLHSIPVFLFIAVSCHNLDVTLQNDIPFIVNDTCVSKVLYYPDTIICTLKVEDLNDTIFQIASIVYDTLSNNTILIDTINWPGNVIQLNKVYDTKQIELTLPGSVMGIYKGVLLLTDEQNASASLPYHVTKVLRDTFNILSPDPGIWKTYRENDAAILPDHFFTSYTIKFLLDSALNCKTTGMRTNYGLKGDFCASINFGLIELDYEKLNGIEVDFIVSTSPDTTQWSGIDAGLYINGTLNRIQVRAAKGINATSKYITYYSGNMRIEKKDTLVSLFCWQGNPQSVPNPLKTVSFSVSDTILYIHLKLKVDDLNYTRYCFWDNFIIGYGEMVF